jgi:exosortase
MGGPNLDQHGAGSGPAGPPWRRILLGALGVALALLAWRPLLGFGLEPEDASLSHGLEDWFFIPSQSIAAAVLAMSLWLLFRRRRALRELPPAPGAAWVGAVLLAGAAAVHVWATRTAANDLLVPSLMLAALAAAWLWKGAPAVRAVLLPLGMLLFAMPLPAPLLNELIYRLQLWTAQLAGFALELATVPHVVMGEEIQRAQQTFSVIETCSGLRSMETLSQVAILMMDLFRRRGVHAVLVVLAAPPVAFALNGLRALLLILSPHSEIAAIHNLQGIAILLAGLVVLFLVDGLLERADRGRAAPEAAPATSPAPARHTPASTRARSAAALGWLAAAAAVSLWLPPWQVPSHEAAGLAERLGLEVGGAPELPTDRIFLGNAGFRESFTRRFDDHGDPVTLFLGMGDRAARERSALSPKTGVPGSGWVTEEEGWTDLPGGRRVHAQLMRSGSQWLLVFHWYENARAWPLEALRSLLALDRSPWRSPREILAVRIETPVLGPLREGRDHAQQVLVRFYGRLLPLLGGEKDGKPRKSFSRFDGSGKKFSSMTPVIDDRNPVESRT